MLALARALVVDPAVLLIDELSMGLAPIIVESLYEIVAEVAESESIAIMIVEQFAHDVLGVATKAGVMLHGRLVTVGSPDQIAFTISDAYLASTAGRARVTDPDRVVVIGAGPVGMTAALALPRSAFPSPCSRRMARIAHDPAAGRSSSTASRSSTSSR